jgi:uncharacterized damage-inducible protein DinB
MRGVRLRGGMAEPTPSTDPELASIRRWFRYIGDARSRYLEAFSKLPSAALLEDRGASYPSVLDIFAHALLAHRNWVVYAYVDTASPASKTVGWTLPETRVLAAEVERALDRFLSSLSAEDLAREFTFHWTTGDPSTRATRTTRDMLWHLVEEELQHRGEINALLWQRDRAVPVLSWDEWAESHPLPR